MNGRLRRAEVAAVAEIADRAMSPTGLDGSAAALTGLVARNRGDGGDVAFPLLRVTAIREPENRDLFRASEVRPAGRGASVDGSGEQDGVPDAEGADPVRGPEAVEVVVAEDLLANIPLPHELLILDTDAVRLAEPVELLRLVEAVGHVVKHRNDHVVSLHANSATVEGTLSTTIYMHLHHASREALARRMAIAKTMPPMPKCKKCP